MRWSFIPIPLSAREYGALPELFEGLDDDILIVTRTREFFHDRRHKKFPGHERTPVAWHPSWEFMPPIYYGPGVLGVIGRARHRWGVPQDDMNFSVGLASRFAEAIGGTSTDRVVFDDEGGQVYTGAAQPRPGATLFAGVLNVAPKVPADFEEYILEDICWLAKPGRIRGRSDRDLARMLALAVDGEEEEVDASHIISGIARLRGRSHVVE